MVDRLVREDLAPVTLRNKAGQSPVSSAAAGEYYVYICVYGHVFVHAYMVTLRNNWPVNLRSAKQLQVKSYIV